MNHPLDYAEFALAIGGLIVSVVGFWVRAIIKNGNAELLASMNKIGTAVEVHVSTDKVIHDDIERRLDRLETRKV